MLSLGPLQPGVRSARRAEKAIDERLAEAGSSRVLSLETDGTWQRIQWNEDESLEARSSSYYILFGIALWPRGASDFKVPVSDEILRLGAQIHRFVFLCLFPSLAMITYVQMLRRYAQAAAFICRRDSILDCSPALAWGTHCCCQACKCVQTLNGVSTWSLG